MPSLQFQHHLLLLAAGSLSNVKDNLEVLTKKRRFFLLAGILFGILGPYLTGHSHSKMLGIPSEADLLMDYVSKTRDVLAMTRSLLASESPSGFGLSTFEQPKILQQLKVNSVSKNYPHRNFCAARAA